jgi:hypothetical protein
VLPQLEWHPSRLLQGQVVALRTLSVPQQPPPLRLQLHGPLLDRWMLDQRDQGTLWLLLGWWAGVRGGGL